MTHFQIGDKVQVTGLLSSQWQDWKGTVVEIVDHVYEFFGAIQECAVDFGDQRRWFMAKHLVRIGPANNSEESSENAA
jgi:hypothetical protein